MANFIVPKVIRWRLRLLEYKFIVLHVPGVENVVADTLSRSFSHRGVELESITADEKHLRLLYVHNEIVGHHGIAKTIDILKAAKLGWKGMYEDVKTFIHNCMVCQKFKTSKHLCKGTLDYHIHGSYPMQSLSVDTLGPLSEDVFGHKYILVIVDNFSKFATLYPTRSTEAKEFVQALIHHIGLFGVPKQIRTDGGTQFTAKICKDLSSILQYEHLVIVPYHPEANGIVERRNAEILKHLRTLVQNKYIMDEWSLVLPLV